MDRTSGSHPVSQHGGELEGAETAFRVTDAVLNLDDITRIVVTHNLERPLLERYDEIIVLKNGSVLEKGSFETLMAQREYFYSLFTITQ